MTEKPAASFDICVIGCGPAGFSAAMAALDLGKRVCIVEGGEIGGAGVKWGALASKTMWELSKDFAIASKTDRGYLAAELSVDYQKVRETVSSAVREKQDQMRTQIETFSPDRFSGPGSLTLKTGQGRFVSQNELEILFSDGKKETVFSEYFLIATGSRPRHIPNIEVDQKQVFDSDGILFLERFPKRMMIIGAGVIGCEYATIFSNFGRTKVSLVDNQDRVIPFEDPDLSRFVSMNLEKNGVEIFHSAQLKDIRKKSDSVEVILDFKDGHTEAAEVDIVLISIGRVIDLAPLDLQNIPLDPPESGRLFTDTCCMVKDNIYAAGDVTHHPSLVNLAELEGRYAVKRMFGVTTEPMTYVNMSTIMFFYPEVAAVGLNEKACRKKKIPFKIGRYSNIFNHRALAMRSLNGFVKIIVTDDDQKKILGMRAAGPQVSSTIVSIAHFMDLGKGVRDVLKSVYPHPSIAEGIQECLRLLIGESVYKPRAFPKDILVKSWDPENGYTDIQ